jgi:hypothetical protein
MLAMSGTGLIPEVEGVGVAPNQEETELAAADTTSGGEIVTPEVRDPLEVQGEPELPDLGLEALHDYRSGGSVPEEAASKRSHMVGSGWISRRSGSYSSPPNRGMNCDHYSSLRFL